MGKRFERERKTKEKDTRERGDDRYGRETLLGDMRGKQNSRGHGKRTRARKKDMGDGLDEFLGREVEGRAREKARENS